MITRCLNCGERINLFARSCSKCGSDLREAARSQEERATEQEEERLAIEWTTHAEGWRAGLIACGATALIFTPVHLLKGEFPAALMCMALGVAAIAIHLRARRTYGSLPPEQRTAVVKRIYIAAFLLLPLLCVLKLLIDISMD